MILVVDDDIDFIEQQKMMLERAGYKVATASSQREAEDLLKQGAKPDLAIVDLMLEHMDGGFSLCHHIKKQNAATPVILVTSVAHRTNIQFNASTPEERSWVKADVTLAKPVRFEQLKCEIDRLLQ